MKNSVRKVAFKFSVTLSLVLGLLLGFNSQYLFSKDALQPKITCHSSSTVTTQQTYTKCVGCTSTLGDGSDAGECRPK
jgi:hypothetical protein